MWIPASQQQRDDSDQKPVRGENTHEKWKPLLPYHWATIHSRCGHCNFLFLTSCLLLRINITYRVLVYWLEIVKCEDVFLCRNVSCECPAENTPWSAPFGLLWPAGLSTFSLVHLTRSALAGKCIVTILIPLFLPSLPRGTQGNLPHYLPVWRLWKGDEIPHSF